MEKYLSPEGFENIDARIEALLAKEVSLWAAYLAINERPTEELDEKEYWVVQEARVSKDRIAAAAHLEEFIKLLETEIAKGHTD